MQPLAALHSGQFSWPPIPRKTGNMTHEESNGQKNKLPIEAEEPKRLVKAGFGDSSITVYQAYPREIAERSRKRGPS